MGSLCRFLLSSPLQWCVRSRLWVLVSIGVRGFRFCCGSALEVFGFWLCGFCFESLVLGLVLAWITGFRFWFESLILGFGLNHWFWVYWWQMVTKFWVCVLMPMLMLMPLFCWWVCGFCWWFVVSGLWTVVMGSWILLMVNRQWLFVVGFHSFSSSSFFSFFFHLAKSCSSLFIYFIFLSSSNPNQRKLEEEERDSRKVMSE